MASKFEATESFEKIPETAHSEPVSEQAEQDVIDAKQEIESKQTSPDDGYLSGAALFSVLGAVTLAIFLMFLDMTIITTVCSIGPDLRRC
jgi:hypothetical protein